MQDDQHPKPDYEVGYGKPPKAFQCQPGQASKNPWGRKGKPENRAKIAERRKQKSFDELVAEVASRARLVSTGDGRRKKMRPVEMILERLLTQAMGGNVTASSKVLDAFHRADLRSGASQVENRSGVLVIPASPGSAEEAVANAKTEQARLRLARAPVADPGAQERRPEPRPTAPPDPREVRAYGEEGVHDRRSVPTAGRSLKADGTYR